MSEIGFGAAENGRGKLSNQIASAAGRRPSDGRRSSYPEGAQQTPRDDVVSRLRTNSSNATASEILGSLSSLTAERYPRSPNYTIYNAVGADLPVPEFSDLRHSARSLEWHFTKSVVIEDQKSSGDKTAMPDRSTYKTSSSDFHHHDGMKESGVVVHQMENSNSDGSSCERRASGGYGILLIDSVHPEFGDQVKNIWHFPALSLSRFSELLREKNLAQYLVSCTDGNAANYDSRPDSRGPCETIEDGKFATNGFRPSTSSSNVPSKGSEELKLATRTKNTTPNQRHYACPFSKHNPLRYEHVSKPCTNPPGLKEFKRVKEHLHNYHSIQKQCPYCKTQWAPGDEYEQAFRDHWTGLQCSERANEMIYPEALNARQVEVLRPENNYRGKDGEKAWAALYQDLFPEESEIPEPYYDYWVMRHTLERRTDGSMSGGRQAYGVYTSALDLPNRATISNQDRPAPSSFNYPTSQAHFQSSGHDQSSSGNPFLGQGHSSMSFRSSTPYNISFSQPQENPQDIQFPETHGSLSFPLATAHNISLVQPHNAFHGAHFEEMACDDFSRSVTWSSEDSGYHSIPQGGQICSPSQDATHTLPNTQTDLDLCQPGSRISVDCSIMPQVTRDGGITLYRPGPGQSSEELAMIFIETLAWQPNYGSNFQG